MCAPGQNSDLHVNDRVVIGHIKISVITSIRDMGPVLEEAKISRLAGDLEDASDSDSIASEIAYREEGGPLRLYPHVREMIDFMVAMHERRAVVEISVVHPLRANCALECLHDQSVLFNQVAFPDADFMPCHFRPSLRQVVVAVDPRDSLHQASLSCLRGILHEQSDERN
jgi:hypothetical protein